MNDSPSAAGPEQRSGPVPGSRQGGRYPHPSQHADLHRRPLHRSAHTLARWWSRVLDGEHVWGSMDIWPSRHGVRRYRLVIFPPGITAAERRLLRLWRAWATWGTLLLLMSVIGLSGVLTPSAAIGISTTVYLGTGAVTLALAAHLRSRVRTLSVAVFDGRTDRRCSAISAELDTLASMLSEADAMRESGRFSPIDHEAVWWRVYDRLGPGHPEPTEEQAWI